MGKVRGEISEKKLWRKLAKEYIESEVISKEIKEIINNIK